MLIKSMGSSHVRKIEAGETAGGRWKIPLGEDLVWDRSNNFVVDTKDHTNVSKEVWDLLLEDSEDFLDVTTLKPVPANLHEKIFQAAEAPSQLVAPAAQVEVGQASDVSPLRPPAE